MRKDVHPAYHFIKVVMTDGTEFLTRSTKGSEGDVINLDIDPLTHPAWTGKQKVRSKGGKLDSYERRFGRLGSMRS